MKTKILVLIILVAIVVIVAVVFVLLPSSTPINAPVVQEGIQITSPKANEEVSFPVEITGYIDGKNNWTGFEGQVGVVKLISKEGVEVAGAPLPATTDWMKFPTYFSHILDFSENIGYIPEGTLVFYNENPSGDPARDRTFSLPIKIKAERDKMVVEAFYVKDGVTGSTCNVVLPVYRLVPKIQAVARAALEELLRGPTAEERNNGFSTTINENVKIQSLKIENGIAYVDFDEQLQYQVGGSCRVSAVRAQITETLKQFSTVNSVVISIDGRTEDILQP